MSGKSLVTVANEGIAQALPLTFEARAVQIHNLSSSWLYVPDAGQPVPPYTYGAVLPLQGTSQARITWQTPSGLLPPTVGKGQATALWVDDSLPPSNGQQVVIPSQQVVCPIELVVASHSAGGSATFTTDKPVPNATEVTYDLKAPGLESASVALTIPVPPGANSLVIDGTITNLDGTADSYSLTATGSTTNTTYLNITEPIGPGAVLQPPFAFIITPAADSTVIVSLGLGGLNLQELTGTLKVVASFGTQAVAVQPGGAPLPVNLNNVLFDGSGNLDVAVQNRLIVGPNGTALPFAASLASGTNLTILAANSMGFGIFGGVVTVDAVAATAVFQMTDHAGVVAYHMTSHQSVPMAPIAACAKNGGDGGLRINNVGNATAFFRGTVVWA